MDCLRTITALYKNFKFFLIFVPQYLFESIEIASRENQNRAGEKLRISQTTIVLVIFIDARLAVASYY